jgi:hypothetical protein
LATNTGEQLLDVVVRCRSLDDLIQLSDYLRANGYPFDLQSEDSREPVPADQGVTRNASTGGTNDASTSSSTPSTRDASIPGALAAPAPGAHQPTTPPETNTAHGTLPHHQARRTSRGNRQAKGSQVASSRLTKEVIPIILVLSADYKYSDAKIARIYGVSAETIRRVLISATWSWVPDGPLDEQARAELVAILAKYRRY